LISYFTAVDEGCIPGITTFTNVWSSCLLGKHGLYTLVNVVIPGTHPSPTAVIGKSVWSTNIYKQSVAGDLLLTQYLGTLQTQDKFRPKLSSSTTIINVIHRNILLHFAHCTSTFRYDVDVNRANNIFIMIS